MSGDVDLGSQGPARGYSWAPFAPGNEVTLRHGAHSPRTIQPLAELFASSLLEVAPWAASPAFAGAVQSWAWAEAQAQVLRAWITEHDLVDVGEDGATEPAAFRMLDRVEGRLAKLREGLGLTPLSLGKLMAAAATVAAATGDTESLRALHDEGRRILASRITEPDPDPQPEGDQP